MKAKVGMLVYFRIKRSGYWVQPGIVKRIIREITPSGYISVRFAGYKDYTLYKDEVIKIEEK